MNTKYIYLTIFATLTPSSFASDKISSHPATVKKTIAKPDPVERKPVFGTEHKSLDTQLKQATKARSIPPFLRKRFSNKPVNIYSIDLDSDGQPDYIVQYSKKFRTCYIKSDNSKQYCEKLGDGDGREYYWFVQLDDSPMLEMISIDIYEDSSDFLIYQFDSRTWKKTLLFRFTPLIQADSGLKNYKGIYWGYPWDIRRLDIKRQGENTFLQVFDCNNKIQKENMAGMSEIQNGPFILFSGRPTQGGKSGSFTKFSSCKQKYTLKQLIRKYSKTNNQTK